jgi:hypothetical protein
MMEEDLLGNETTELEREVARSYEALKALAAREDAPPCVRHNVRKALACLWQAANGLDLRFEQLQDLGL